MKSKKIYTAVAALLLILMMQPLFAQYNNESQTRDIWLSIDETYQTHDTIIASLRNADKLELTGGMLLRAFQSPVSGDNQGKGKKEFQETGSGYIFLQQGNPLAVIRMYKGADTLGSGDMIKLTLNVPILPYRSVFSELAFMNLVLTHSDKSPLYSLDYLLQHDSKKVEDSLYNVIIGSFQETYELIKQRGNIPDVMLTPIGGGRFANRIPMEMLKDVTRQDLESFFQYMKEYPVGYMGKRYRASESFAGWVVSNSPYSAGEIRKILFPLVGNKTAFAKQISILKRDILSEHSAKQIALDALDLSEQKRFAEAHTQTDLAIAMAETVKDTAALPVIFLCKAQLFQDDDKYSDAIAWSDKAIRASQLANDYEIEMQARAKKGYCLYRISKYKEAEQGLNDAAKRLSAMQGKLSEQKYNEALRKIYEYRATIRYRSGRYEEALKLLDTAIQLNQRINSYDALVTNAGYYKFIGQVYNEQGRPEDALVAFSRADTIYRNSGDVLRRAIVENEIAYSYFKTGNYRAVIGRALEAKRKLLQENDRNNAGYSESLMGSAYRELGLYDSALLAHRRSILLRQLSGNLEGQADSWERMGDLYKLSGSKNAALQAYDTALYNYRLLKDSSGMADIYNAKGQVYLGDENYKRATDWFEQARGISPKSTVEALYKLGMAWNSIDTVKARNYYVLARKKSIEDGNIPYHFYAARALGVLAYRSQDMQTGDRYYTECVTLSQRMKTAYTKASCLSLRAYRFESETLLDSALHYYQQAMAITDTADKSESVSLLNDVAGVYISKGEFKNADKAYKQAMAIAVDLADSLSLGSTLQLASFLHSLTAEFEKGVQANDSAIAIFRKTGMLLRLAGAYAARGALFSSMGDNRNAVSYYQTADSLYKDEYQEEQRRTIYNNIGVVYNSQGDYTRALKYLQQSLVVSGRNRVNENYLLIQGNIAEALLGLKRTAEAKTLLLDILPKAQQMKLQRIASGMALVLGKIYYDEKNMLKANEYYTYAADYARQSGEQEKMITALVNIARIHSSNNNQAAAMPGLQEGVSLARRYKTANAWQAFYEMGLLHYGQKRYDSAVAYFREAVELLDKAAGNLYGGEDARKLFNNDPRKADLYNKIVFSWYNLGNIKEAWAYANRSSIAGIKELSGSLSVNSGDEERNEALRKLLSMQQSRKALENTLEKLEGQNRRETLKKIEILEADYNNFLQDAVAQYPELSTYFSRSNADEFNNYKGKLPDDVAVALYLQNGKTLMIFTLTNEKLAVDTMTVDIAPRISTFISTIKNTQKQTGTGPLSERSEPVDEGTSGETGDFKSLSDELYNYLIASVEDKMAGKKRWCIMPTGIFSNLPFQCLGRKTGTDGFRFILEDHSIFYSNKMSVFNNKKDEDSGDKLKRSFAAFGVPDAKLQYNITEVKNIGKILGADSTIYTDSRATESQAKYSLRNKRYVHFATHGVLNYSSDYSQSYLKLLPDKDTADGNNGQLTMREVQRLGIRDCDMVILSACQTAVAKELVEGWSISPANSFLVSHVKSVVASLWKVADEPTGLLMGYFYENLRANMEKAEALRQAQMKLSQDPRYRHPNYWGAFVLYGEWR